MNNHSSKPSQALLSPTFTAKSTSFLLAQVGNQSLNLFSHYLLGLDIKIHHFQILALAEQETMTQAQLAQQLGMSNAPVVQYLHYLEQRGLVKRTRSLNVRHANDIVLTTKGREILAKALTFARQAEAEILAPLSLDEQIQLKNLMYRLSFH